MQETEEAARAMFGWSQNGSQNFEGQNHYQIASAR